MKIAYFDCPSGISGNMLLGALLDSGLDPAYLRKQIGRLRLKVAASNSRGNREVHFQVSEQLLQIIKIKKHGIAGIHVAVKSKKEKTSLNLKDILSIINKSGLSKRVKSLSSRVFKRLAEAEARVHGIPVGKVHFHEVGAVDAIIDVVGACVGIEKLGIEKIYCSPLPNGKGRIVHAHGLLPNPSPAAAALLKGIPTYGVGIKGELVTPTGAAIITTLAESFCDLPRMRVESIGYGAGTIDLPIPNLLRVFIGEAQIPSERDAVLQIETNIDDMDPKLYDRAISNIMKSGALDASLQPIRMKKRRDAVKLVALCRPEDKDKVLDAVFTETTTIGVRVYLVPREKLSRVVRAGKKISYLGSQVKRVKPE